MWQGDIVQDIDTCPPPSSAQFTDLPVDWCPVINQFKVYFRGLEPQASCCLGMALSYPLLLG
jgi:hypothetical protein